MKIYSLMVLVIFISVGSLYAQQTSDEYNFKADSVKRLLEKYSARYNYY